MHDATLFETILGLQAPWHIARVTLDTAGARVALWVEHSTEVMRRAVARGQARKGPTLTAEQRAALRAVAMDR